MFSIRGYIFFSSLFLMGNAERLFGGQMTDAVKILNRALDLLIHEGAPIYSQHGVDAAYKFTPNIVYTFDSTVQEYRGNYKQCMISISYSYGEVNVLVTIKCDGDNETIKRIVNEKIFVNDKNK